MNVSLTPELNQFVDEIVANGRYGSASEAVRAGLRMLQEHEAKFERLKAAIEEGLNSGEPRPLDMEHFLKDARAEWEKRQRNRRAAE